VREAVPTFTARDTAERLIAWCGHRSPLDAAARLDTAISRAA
jgi:hypothetical protein